MVDHGQDKLQIDMKKTWSTMYNHGCITCLAMVYHGKLLKTETMEKHSQPGFRFKRNMV